MIIGADSPHFYLMCFGAVCKWSLVDLILQWLCDRSKLVKAKKHSSLEWLENQKKALLAKINFAYHRMDCVDECKILHMGGLVKELYKHT